ncbi:Protein of unknown function [Pyronema omphalodes CBS 100304]|uniref:Uncharacterized protein n=1 Tax=Pyronema omphalodes (strain CBS 100304) TaxID=1076935 RepID=U4LVP6_PYROM|nr:Protein of unknown function [Pyronema omphalodes CBS 100304]
MGESLGMTEKGALDEKFAELQSMIGDFALMIPMPWVVRLLLKCRKLWRGMCRSCRRGLGRLIRRE